jgi:hypothetical protein
MSGGKFNYDQDKIKEIADKIEHLIEKNGKQLDDEELDELRKYQPVGWEDMWPEDKYHTKYEPETIDKFKEGFDILNKAYIYAQRIDWLLSGDDGEDNFHNRLESDLNEYESNG